MCPVAEDLFAREVSVWLDPAWSDADADAVAAGINKVLSAYCTRRPGKAAWL
jgi:dTDP-4-amino-4,6-dideoxygalactose transaminase